MVISIQKALFGKISDREIALDLVTWNGDEYFGCAALLIVFALLSNIPLFLGCAILLGGCGYFTRFKKSRIAVITGLLLVICCFVLTAVLPPHMSGGLMFGLAGWIGVRGTLATFKVHGIFAGEGSGALPGK